MGSRALRRLQQEQELEKQLAAARIADVEEDAEDEQEEFSTPITSKKPKNAFDMLHETEEESEPEEDQSLAATSTTQTPEIEGTSTPTASKPKKKKKKPKKKAKEKEKSAESAASVAQDDDLDEVDRALRELSAQEVRTRGDSSLGGEGTDTPDYHSVTATKLLGIDPKHLNPVNEMKSLFGNIALEGTSNSRSSPRNVRQREQNQQGGADLATALTGRYSPASRGKDLGALASKRNVFMQGREWWPLTTSGGLSMERETDASSSEKKYSIMHSNIYQSTQGEFRICVEMMDQQNMVQLLIRNPYHIATLLQVSEIAKHQGDHSVTGDLLERALFSFGRSVHSTFSVALREGSARLAFNKPANRELYLTIWRYMKNLEMRGTWRTAFEWAKILLQLDPRSDPYGVTLMIDQLALRGRQNAALIELCSDEAYGSTWSHLPNIQVSLALAYQRSSQPKLARRALALAMHKYPYLLSALASSLDITPMPQSLWGKLASTDAEKLYTELYVTQAKDLWNTPESSALIVEVAQTLNHYSGIIKSATPAPKLEISLEEARHIMLLDIPSLIALLPRRFTNMPTSSSDTLPPPNSLAELTARAPAGNGGPSSLQTLLNAAGAAAAAPMNAVNQAAARVLQFWRPGGANRTEDYELEEERDAAFEALNDQLGGGVPRHVLEEILSNISPENFDADDDNLATGPLFPMGPTIGDFDYYIEHADGPSDDSDSMPELEAIPDDSEDVAVEPRNPHAATVEETDDDDDEDAGTTARRPGRNRTMAERDRDRAVLRRMDSDSDSDDDGMAATLRRLQFPPGHPEFVPSPAVSTPPPQAEPQSSPQTYDDPQRLQRWLISAGLTMLQNTPESLDDYVVRLKMLRQQQQEWVVQMVGQRAGRDVAARLTEALGK